METISENTSSAERLLITRQAPIVIKPPTSGPTTVNPSLEIITVKPANVVHISPSSQSAVVVRPQKVTVVQPVLVPAAVVRPAIAVRVDPPKRGAWSERGWTMRTEGHNQVYEGNYHAGKRTFSGRIQVEGRSRITAFIHNPPAEIKRHRKGPCFQQCGLGTGWFILHWRRSAQNVDDAILYMERILDESLRS